MGEVLPPAPAPTRHISSFLRLTPMKNRPGTCHSLRSPLKSYGGVITADTCGRAVERGNSVSCRRPERRRVLYFLRDTVDEGAAMCDEYYDARMKAFWRALAEVDEQELDEKEDEPIVQPLVLEISEPQKAKPKTLVR